MSTDSSESDNMLSLGHTELRRRAMGDIVDL